MNGGAFTDEARAFVDQLGEPCLEKPFEIALLCHEAGKFDAAVRRVSKDMFIAKFPFRCVSQRDY